VPAGPYCPSPIRECTILPPIGWWFWIVPDGPRVGRYHQVRSTARLRSSDEEQLDVVESVCRQAFSLDRVIDVAAPGDPVLRQFAGDLYASCGICLDHRPSRPNWEARILQDARRARDRGGRGEWQILSDSLFSARHRANPRETAECRGDRPAWQPWTPI